MSDIMKFRSGRKYISPLDKKLILNSRKIFKKFYGSLTTEQKQYIIRKSIRQLLKRRKA